MSDALSDGTSSVESLAEDKATAARRVMDEALARARRLRDAGHEDMQRAVEKAGRAKAAWLVAESKASKARRLAATGDQGDMGNQGGMSLSASSGGMSNQGDMGLSASSGGMSNQGDIGLSASSGSMSNQSASDKKGKKGKASKKRKHLTGTSQSYGSEEEEEAGLFWGGKRLRR